MSSPDPHPPPEPVSPQAGGAARLPGRAERGLRRLWAGRERVVGWLRLVFPRAPPDAAETVFTDTVLELHEAHGELDALTAPWSLIRVRCWRRLRALVRSDRARREREGRWAETQRREVPPRDLAAEQRAEAMAGLADQIRESLLDERMRITFELWLAGERETAEYAKALGLEALRVSEQRRAVKRERDRLRVYLCRHPAVREAYQEFLGE